MEHVPGKLDFTVETKEFSVTDFRRRISSVWRYVEVPGCIAVISRKGKPECALMSIETYACMSEDYEAEMARVEAASREYQAKRKAARGAKRNGTQDM